MEKANNGQERKAKGFFAFFDKKGKMVGGKLNMDANDQLHPSEEIGNDLAQKGLIKPCRENARLSQLNFNNFRIDELANQLGSERNK